MFTLQNIPAVSQLLCVRAVPPSPVLRQLTLTQFPEEVPDAFKGRSVLLSCGFFFFLKCFPSIFSLKWCFPPLHMALASSMVIQSKARKAKANGNCIFLAPGSSPTGLQPHSQPKSLISSDTSYFSCTVKPIQSVRAHTSELHTQIQVRNFMSVCQEEKACKKQEHDTDLTSPY